MLDKSSINRLLRKLRDIGTVNRLTGGGKPQSASTEETVELVDDLVLSQKDTPHTHRTVREISRQTGIRLTCYETVIMSCSL